MFIMVWLTLCIMQPLRVIAIVIEGSFETFEIANKINGCESAGFCETSTVCYVKIAKQF